MAAVGLLAAVTFCATGCSSDAGGGSGSDKIAGAGSAEGGSSSPSASASHPAEKNAPSFDLPSDLKIDVESKATGDATKDAILRDAAYSAQANIEAFAQGESQAVNLNRYFAGDALTYWVKQVADFKKSGLTLTGYYRYYDFKVTDVANGKTAAVSYCEDQSKGFSKRVKTGKVLRTSPSDKSYVLYTLQASKDQAGDWQVTRQSWKKGDATCVQG
ncbi:hypothetical protein ABZT03_04945 [Streptomyces sp. NPDC005574]|uniref:hypothetical protein n=1 Tax=Streptomyces sp. NPDC005574 TaxID=3156891 RepID=UPI00339F90AF